MASKETSAPEAAAPAALKTNVAAELIISERWDKCLERTVINLGTGAVVGLLSGFVLARTGHGRSIVTALGIGAGAGASWVRCAQDFEKKEEGKGI